MGEREGESVRLRERLRVSESDCVWGEREREKLRVSSKKYREKGKEYVACA